jgi:hypothetical protein
MSQETLMRYAGIRCQIRSQRPELGCCGDEVVAVGIIADRNLYKK